MKKYMIAMMGLVIAMLLGTNNTFGEVFHCYGQWEDFPPEAGTEFAQHMLKGKSAAKVARQFNKFRFKNEVVKGGTLTTVAGNIPACGEGDLPTTVSVFETVVCNAAGLTCLIERSVDLNECQIGGDIGSDIILVDGCPGCPAATTDTNESLQVVETELGTVTALSASCNLVFAQDSSFRYCYPNAVGSMTCITF